MKKELEWKAYLVGDIVCRDECSTIYSCKNDETKVIVAEPFGFRMPN
jgi:hypothetical protein